VLVTVYCFDLVSKKSSFWNKERDTHLRMFYGDRIKVDPAILAFKLKTSEACVLNRLSKLGLRNKRAERNA
jgi:hypothetical protein